MKLTLYSDLHLEFDPHFLPTNPGSEVLILAGDISVADIFTRSEASPKYAEAQLWKEFFQHCSDQWENVIYIAGNHEHYHGRLNDTTDILKDTLSHLENIHVLDNEFIDLGGYRFLGTTLWTDMKRNDPLVENYIRSRMNDYNLIQYKDGPTYRKLIPMDTMKFHEKAKDFISKNIQGPTVVVGHHAPSYKSVHPRYDNVRDYGLNYAYFSDMDQFIDDRHDIKLWCHGHCHHVFDYYIGNTRVMCNPKGYNNENPLFNEKLVIEL